MAAKVPSGFVAILKLLVEVLGLLVLIACITQTAVGRADDAEDSDPPTLMTGAAPHDEAPGMMGPLVAIDVSPGNSVTAFAPHWVRTPEGREIGFGFRIDKMLSENWDIEIDSEWDSVNPHEGPRQSGISGIDVLSRYLFVNQSDLQLGVAPQLSISTHEFDQSFGISNAGLALLGGTRGDELPEGWDLGYFRAIELHSDLGYSRILSNGSGDEIFFDPVIDYSIPYLQYLNKSEYPWPLSHLCFFAELNFDAMVSGDDRGEPTLYTTPGVSYIGDFYQVSLGAQVPLNHAAEQNQQLALLGDIDFDLDGLPVLGWMPF